MGSLVDSSAPLDDFSNALRRVRNFRYPQFNNNQLSDSIPLAFGVTLATYLLLLPFAIALATSSPFVWVYCDFLVLSNCAESFGGSLFTCFLLRHVVRLTGRSSHTYFVGRVELGVPLSLFLFVLVAFVL